MTGKESLFRKDFWKTDLAVSVIYGFAVGYHIQEFAESTDISSDPRIFGKVMISAATGFFAYLLVFLVARFFLSRFIRLPSWVWVAIVGSVFFAVARETVGFFLYSLPYCAAVSECVQKVLPLSAKAFPWLTLMFSLPLLALLLLLRLVVSSFQEFKAQKK